MFCKRCGTEIKPNESACGNCGEPVKQKPKRTLAINNLVFLNVRASINYVSLSGALLTLIGLFTPYIIVSAWGYSQSVTLMSLAGFIGIPVLLIAGATTVLNCLKMESMIPGLLLIFFELLAYFVTKEDIQAYGFGLAKHGIGCYLGIIGSILITFACDAQDFIDKIYGKN